jgi:hypothetical protein
MFYFYYSVNNFKASREVDWRRTGNKNFDELAMYETSQMYDCTLKVGNDKLGFKVMLKITEYRYRCFKNNNFAGI